MTTPNAYPPKAVCAATFCGHVFAVHDPDFEVCIACEAKVEELEVEELEAEMGHKFVPVRLAAGALTPDEERAAYEQAMRGAK